MSDELIHKSDVLALLNGEWIYGEFDIPHCSECGMEVMPCNISKYCPNCGARMESEDNENE
ncbi:MAG: hypothetical protein II388_04960 [Clostridia bacterium]|nr:hypothetical protein [Clostridia bacterium]